MPLFTPNVKVQHTKKLGARVILHGESLSEADTHAHQLADEHGLTFVHPYDDEKVIAGQGTVALEMLEAIPDLDVLIVPVGGGGLISGMALAAKARKPDIEVIGVQTALYPSMVQALDGKTIDCGGQTIAEGIAVKRPGTLTQAIIRDFVEDVLVVEEDHIERAMVLYLEIEKTVAEGAGAAALAAVLAQPQRFAGRKIGLVLSGGNVDSRLLASVIMRGLVRSGRLIRLHIEIPDAPGQLARVTALVGEHEGNIVDVSHHRMMLGLPAKSAELDLLVEIREPAHGDKLVAALEAGGFRVRRASPS
jgi:threonine dehydratase